MKHKIWEMGSSFHDCTHAELDTVYNQEFIDDIGLYISGRHALLDLILYQKERYGLEVVFIPSYYCHDVTKLIEKIVTVKHYVSDPLTTTDLSIFPRDSTIILVEYFGNQAKVKGVNNDLFIILDKTHNPFSEYNYCFNIDYYFGSLRKVLPLSDGGFLSPSLPESQIKFIESAKTIPLRGSQKAMRLKALFLRGKDIKKDSFLKDFDKFEAFLNESAEIHAISSESHSKLLNIDYRKLLSAKSNNINYLNTYYKDSFKFNLFSNSCYFSFFVQPRDFVRLKSRLVENNIYPIVLWPDYNGDYSLIDGHILISLHVDFRYELADIVILTKILDGVICEL